MSYQGHKNWNHWNVSLWILNKEPWYRDAQRALRHSHTLDEATDRLLADLPEETPDGAPITFSAVREMFRGYRAGPGHDF